VAVEAVEVLGVEDLGSVQDHLRHHLDRGSLDHRHHHHHHHLHQDHGFQGLLLLHHHHQGVIDHLDHLDLQDHLDHQGHLGFLRAEDVHLEEVDLGVEQHTQEQECIITSINLITANLTGDADTDIVQHITVMILMTTKKRHPLELTSLRKQRQ